MKASMADNPGKTLSPPQFVQRALQITQDDISKYDFASVFRW
jgi:hypothetical protein